MERYPIIAKLGGARAVRENLRERMIIRRDTMNQWRRRGSIPGHAMRALMELAEENGIPYKAADFRVDTLVAAKRGANGKERH